MVNIGSGNGFLMSTSCYTEMKMSFSWIFITCSNRSGQKDNFRLHWNENIAKMTSPFQCFWFSSHLLWISPQGHIFPYIFCANSLALDLRIYWKIIHISKINSLIYHTVIITYIAYKFISVNTKVTWYPYFTEYCNWVNSIMVHGFVANLVPVQYTFH